MYSPRSLCFGARRTVRCASGNTWFLRPTTFLKSMFVPFTTVVVVVPLTVDVTLSVSEYFTVEGIVTHAPTCSSTRYSSPTIAMTGATGSAGAAAGGVDAGGATWAIALAGPST